MNVMSLKIAFKEFENQFNKHWTQYVQLHRDLDEYRGQAITPKNVDDINKIVSDMQDEFAELWMSFQFVKERYAHVTSALDEHKKFMDMMKETGAQPEDEAENTGDA